MNRVTRFSSAAFGMLMIAGLAYYQGHENITAGEQEVLIGTAIPEASDPAEPERLEAKANDCEKGSEATEPEEDRCLNKDS